MHFLLIPIKSFEHVFLEVFEEDIFHLVGDFVEEASNIFVSVEIVEEPSESLVDPHDVVVQVEESIGEVVLELAHENVDKSRVRLEVVEGVDNLLNVEVYVCVIVLKPDGVGDFVLALTLFDQDHNQSV